MGQQCHGNDGTEGRTSLLGEMPVGKCLVERGPQSDAERFVERLYRPADNVGAFIPENFAKARIVASRLQKVFVIKMHPGPHLSTEEN